MINYRLQKVAIILLIAVFSIVGIVACGGANDVTGSASQGSVVPAPNDDVDLGDNNGDNGDKWNVEETKGMTFDQNTYVQIYVAWVSPNWFKVSYQDTNRLDRMWKAMIDRTVKDGQRRLYIKTSDGDLYFDQDYNIRWTKKADTALKIFQGGAITKLKEGYGNNEHSAREYGDFRYSERYVLGGFYSYAVDYRTVCQWNSKTVNWFFGEAAAHIDTGTLKAGRMELLALHPGYPVDLSTGRYFNGAGEGVSSWKGTAYAVQVLMPSQYMANYDLVRGNAPETYLPKMNITHQLYHQGLRWDHSKTYAPDGYR